METELGKTIKITYMGLDEFPERSEPAMWVEYGERPHDWCPMTRFCVSDPALKDAPHTRFPMFVVMQNMTVIIEKVTDVHRVAKVYLDNVENPTKAAALVAQFDIHKGCGMTFVPKS